MKNQTTKFQIELLLVLCALFLFPVRILIGATISVSGGGCIIPWEPKFKTYSEKLEDEALLNAKSHQTKVKK